MIVKHTLPNGLRVVAEQIPYVRSVAMGIWVHTGSRNELPKSNGISHFLEHMLFKGTKNRTARQLAEAFDEIGGQVNAFTSKEITCYYAKVLDNHFTRSLEILADMFLNSVFDIQEMEKEKKVVIEEIRMVEDTPDDIIHDLLAEVSFHQHSLGFPVIGTIENVQQFSAEDLIQYHQTYYQPQNVVIALAGNLPDHFLESIESIFHQEAGTAKEKSEPEPHFTPKVRIRQKPTEQTHLCLGFPGLSVDDPKIYQAIVLNTILGGNMSSRLFQKIREEKGLAYSVYSYHSSYQKTGLFSVYAGTAHEQVNEVISNIQEIIEQVCHQGVTQTELEKSKEQLKANLMLSLESTNNRMSRLGRNEILLQKHFSLDDLLEQVDQIRLDDVNHLAKQIFASPYSLAMISPDGQIPTSYRRTIS